MMDLLPKDIIIVIDLLNDIKTTRNLQRVCKRY